MKNLHRGWFWKINCKVRHSAAWLGKAFQTRSFRKVGVLHRALHLWLDSLEGVHRTVNQVRPKLHAQCVLSHGRHGLYLSRDLLDAGRNCQFCIKILDGIWKSGPGRKTLVLFFPTRVNSPVPTRCLLPYHSTFWGPPRWFGKRAFQVNKGQILMGTKTILWNRK